MSDAAFDAAVRLVLQHEGGYSNDPNDAGGETQFGITKRSYPDLDIRRITKTQAASIYKTDWWDKYELAALPDLIGAKMLDLGVNMGMYRATQCLQRAIQACGGEVTVDGNLGPKTRAAAAAIDAPALLNQIRQQAAEYYRRLAEDHPVNRRFLKGWLNRALS